MNKLDPPQIAFEHSLHTIDLFLMVICVKVNI